MAIIMCSMGDVFIFIAVVLLLSLCNWIKCRKQSLIERSDCISHGYNVFKTISIIVNISVYYLICKLLAAPWCVIREMKYGNQWQKKDENTSYIWSIVGITYTKPIRFAYRPMGEMVNIQQCELHKRKALGERNRMHMHSMLLCNMLKTS